MHVASEWPNLFVIGAMKSGSSYLHGCLSLHPEIHMSPVKEPSFFAPDTRPGQDFALRSEAHYLELFSCHGDVAYRGESSTNYTKSPLFGGVAARIAGRCPTARLLYVVRDPTERAISHYWHRVRFHGETRAPVDAATADSQYLAVSSYAAQLRDYLNVFPAKSLKVVCFERLVSQPDDEMRTIFHWLGVGDCPRPMPRSAANPTPPLLKPQTGQMVDRRTYELASLRESLATWRARQVSELRALTGDTFPEWGRPRAQALG